MEITRTARAEQVEIKLKGRMDAGLERPCRPRPGGMRAVRPHCISLDMAEVDYISSAGIRILVLYARQLKAIQGSFSVVNASQPVRRVLELAGLDSLLLRSPTQPQRRRRATEPAESVGLAEAGCHARSLRVESGGRDLRVHWPGNPAAGSTAPPLRAECERSIFPPTPSGLAWAVSVIGEADDAAWVWRISGAAGAMICQPADGANKPDYMLLQGGTDTDAEGGLWHGLARVISATCYGSTKARNNRACRSARS